VLLAEAQRWREDAVPLATGWVDLSQQRGWLVAWGTLAWHRAIGDRASPAARAIARLLALLVPARPPLATVVREGFWLARRSRADGILGRWRGASTR
jgi:hypothetical protein